MKAAGTNASPFAFVTTTSTRPGVLAKGAIAVNCVGLRIVGNCPTPVPKSAVVPATKFVPVKVTFVPPLDVPTIGDRAVTVGDGPAGVVTVKATPLEVRLFVVTVTGPVAAPAGTCVSNCVGVARNAVAGTPLTLIWLDAAVALNPVPVMVTSLVGGPVLGVNVVMAGGEALTVKLAVAEPVVVETVTTVAPTRAAKLIVKVAVTVVAAVRTLLTAIPGLSVASAAPIRFVPASETLTVAPAAPLLGEIPVIVGAPTPPVLRVMDSRLPTAS